MRHRTILSVAIIVLCALTSTGQQHPNTEKGFDPNRVYAFDSLDAINTFNGNLVITIPLGPTYSVDGNLKYALKLVYNSQPFEAIERWMAVTRLVQGNPQIDYDVVQQAMPDRRSNAGIGWSVSLGRLIDPKDPTNRTLDPYREDGPAFIYESADGHDRQFVPEPRRSSENPYLLLDREPLFMRMSKLSDTFRVIEFGDGTQQLFQNVGGSVWRLIKISDKFNNTVTISYTDSPTQEVWEIKQYRDVGAALLPTDRPVRTQKLTFSIHGDTSPKQKTLDKVELTSFASTLVYDFDYCGSGACIRSLKHPSWDSYATRNGTTPSVDFRVRMLQGISAHAAGSSTTLEEYHFVYEGDAYYPGDALGLLRAMQLPTGGWMEYSWEPRQFPRGATLHLTPKGRRTPWPITGPLPPSMFVYDTNRGVSRKRLLDGSRQFDGKSEWIYGHQLTAAEGYHGDATYTDGTVVDGTYYYRPQLVTSVTPPADESGHQFTNVTYYSVYTTAFTDPSGAPVDVPLASLGPWKPNEYGLPITRFPNTSPADDVALSNEIHEGVPLLDTTVDNPRVGTDATRKKTTYLAHTAVRPSVLPNVMSWLESSRRVEFQDDRATPDGLQYYNQETKSGYDGYGNFRQIYTASNYPVQSGQPSGRTTFTNYQAPSSAYILGTYTERCAQDEYGTPPTDVSACSDLPRAVVERFCFDSATGFLKRKRFVGDTSNPLHDVVVDYGYDLLPSTRPSGNVGSETFYGADEANAPSGCDPASGDSKYKILHEYDWGVRRKSYYRGFSSTPFLDLTIEQSSGVPSASRDSSGVVTAYTYDALSRLHTVASAGVGTITYDYFAASALQNAYVTATQPTADAGTMYSRYDYDPFGRLITQSIAMPGGTAITDTTYDKLGRLSTVSQPHYATEEVFVSRYGYDFDGRLVSFSHPDGAVDTTTFRGNHILWRQSKAWGRSTSSLANQITRTSREEADWLGRLIQVDEDPNADCVPTDCADYQVSAKYGYDVRDHLVTVKMSSPAVAGEQVRTFSYDQRGFLTGEKHPEADAVTYSSFDAKGHAAQKRVATNPLFDTNLEFDAAERLRRVLARQPETNQFRELKAFEYGDATTSSPSNRNAGKIRSATRHNYTADGDVSVTETYTYGDAAGRLTEKTTAIARSGAALKTFSQSYEYNQLGQPKSILYPTCVGGGCSQSVWDKVTTSFSVGLPQSVTAATAAGTTTTAFASNITYAASGVTTDLTHGNPNFVDHQTLAFGLPRPAQITFTGSTCDLPVISDDVDDAGVAPGGTAHFSVVATSASSSVHYVWHLGTDPSMQFADAPSIDIANVTQSTTVWVDITNACGTATSRHATLTVGNCKVTISSTVGDKAPAGTPVTYKATLSCTTCQSLSFTWRDAAGTVVGASDTYSFTMPNSDVTLSVEVVCDGIAYTGQRTTLVGCDPYLTVNPPGAVDPTTTVTYTANVCGCTTAQFQWYQVVNGSRMMMTGETGPSLTVTPVVSVSYSVDVSGCGDTKTLNVTTQVNCLPFNLFIFSKPQSPVMTSDGFVELDAVAVWTNNQPVQKALTYQWYRGEAGDTSQPAGNSALIFVYGGAPVQSFWVHAEDGCNSVNSRAVNVYTCMPKITQQPAADNVIPMSGSATLTVTATSANSSPLRYEWYRGNSFTPIANATTNQLTVSAADADTYHAAVYGTCDTNLQSQVLSANAVVRTCTPPVVNFTSPGVQEIERNTTVTLSVNATGDDLTYQWYRGVAGDISTPIMGAQISSYAFAATENGSFWLRIRSRAVCATDTATFVVNVCDKPSLASVTSADAEVNPGGATTLSATASGTNLTYQWYRQAAGAAAEKIGTNIATLATGPLNTDTSFWVVAASGSCTRQSNIVTVHVCNDMSIRWTTAVPSPMRVGDSFTLSVTANPPAGSTTVLYWYRGTSGDVANSVLLNGPTTATVIPVTPTETTSYWVRLKKTSSLCFIDTGTLTLNVCIPTITQNPASTLINAGTSTTLSVSANTTGLTYQWYIGTTSDTTRPISGATASTLTVAPAVDTTYWVRVTGTCGVFADSATATVTVCKPVAITTQPSDASIVLPEAAGLQVVATGTNLSYQWYQGTSGSTTFPVGTNSATYVFSPTAPGDYWVRVSGSCGTPVNSRTAHVSVCTTPTITKQPQSMTIFSGSTATLTVSANDSTGEPVHYQWYSGTTAVGSDSATYTTPPLTAPADIHVRITAGRCTADSQSATVAICALPQNVQAPANQQIALGGTAKLSGVAAAPNRIFRWFIGASGDTSQPQTPWQAANSVNLAPGTTTQVWYQVQDTTTGCLSNSGTATIFVCIPTITQQPASVLITRGTSTTLSVAANTAGLTYQWYTGTSGVTSSPVAGATTASLTVAPSVDTSYWVRVTGTCGIFADSATATVTLCQTPAITTQPADASVTYGTTVGLQVTATGTNLTYQWYQGTSGNTTTPVGPLDSTYIFAPTTPGDYWVRVNGMCGSVNSRTVHVSVCTTPTIRTQPQPVTVFSGGSATLSVSAYDSTGEPVHYQWYAGSTAVGTDSPTYTTPPLYVATTYRVVVTAGVCSAYSQTATVAICALPQTVAAPADQQIAVGATARLTGVASWTGRSFRWYSGTTGDTSRPQTGWITANYFDVAPQQTTQYWYQVQDTSSGCLSNSGTATVSVCIPTITQQPASIMISSGSSTTLLVAANTAGLSYQWYVGLSGTQSYAIPGANGPTLVVAPTTTTNYWVRVTGSCGVYADSVTATVSVCNAPAITGQPTDQPAIAAGTGQVLAVDATGDNLAYQWYLGMSGDVSTPVGINDRTLTLSSVPYTQYYWVRISGTCGTADSRSVAVSVNPVITQQPPSALYVSPNSCATISLRASGAYLHYQWINSTTGETVGTDSSVLYTPPITTFPTRFYCKVTSGPLGVTYAYTTTVNACNGVGTSMASQPSSTPGCTFVAVTITKPSTVGVTVRWYKGRRGDTSHDVTQTNPTWINACESGTYWCRVTRTDTSCTTDSAEVTVP